MAMTYVVIPYICGLWPLINVWSLGAPRRSMKRLVSVNGIANLPSSLSSPKRHPTLWQLDPNLSWTTLWTTTLIRSSVSECVGVLRMAFEWRFRSWKLRLQLRKEEGQWLPRQTLSLTITAAPVMRRG